MAEYATLSTGQLRLIAVYQSHILTAWWGAGETTRHTRSRKDGTQEPSEPSGAVRVRLVVSRG